jgi:hypothetical protein
MRFIQASLLLAVSATPALAQREPEIVIPGRPDVPVIINGVDASWGVLEGDFGLFRPGQVNPVVVSRPLYVTMPVGVPRYFPSSDRAPGYGRLEINPPNRRLPQRPPTINKIWTSQSPNVPVTTYPTYPQNYMPFNVSPLLMMGGTSNGGSPNTPNAPNVWQRGSGAPRRP